jgi:flagellar biosynthesis/type III secretory pathway protein FliH
MSLRGAQLLFADDFAIAEDTRPDTAPAAAEPPPPPPSYDQTALDAACAAARAEGFAQGSDAASASLAAQVAATLTRIAEQLAEAVAGAARVAEEGAEVFARLLLSAMLAGYPQLRARYGEEEIRALVRRLLPALRQETRVTFHVHPSMVPAITAELAAVPQSERQHMVFEPSETIPPGEARIAWPNGAAIRDTVQAQAEIAEILGPLGLLPEPAAAATDAEQG